MRRRINTSHRTRRSYLRSLSALDAALRPELFEHDDFHDGWTAIRPRTFTEAEHEHNQIIITEQDEYKLRRLARGPCASTIDERGIGLEAAVAQTQFARGAAAIRERSFCALPP